MDERPEKDLVMAEEWHDGLENRRVQKYAALSPVFGVEEGLARLSQKDRMKSPIIWSA